MNWNKSITARFILVLLLVLLVGQGIGTFFFLRTTRIKLLTDLHGRMERTVGQAAAVVADPLLNYNFPFIDSCLEGYLQDPDILSVGVFDDKGKVIAEKSAGEIDLEPFVSTRTILSGETVLGEFRITYAGRTIDAWMDKSLMVIPSYQLAMLVAVAAILILLLNFHIRTPLSEINRVVKRVTSGDLTVAMPRFREDDIGVIARGVGFLVEGLARTIARIHSISKNSFGAMGELSVTFDHVNRVIGQQQASIGEVSRSVKSASEAQQRIVEGTAELLNLSEGNASALLEMKATSEEIAGGTEQLSGNINNSLSTLTQLTQTAKVVAGMADEVTRAVESSSSSIEEIFGSLKEVESIVRQSTLLSDETTSIISEKGMASVANAAQSMRSLETFMAALSSSIKGMETRSRDIGQVLTVIGEVTNQLKLLSLNAQIIAAQAGVHGQGFAVVANQMRQLSERTANSTLEIEGIVSLLQEEINGVVQGAGDATRVVGENNRVVQETAEVFKETLGASQRAAEISRKIERASIEQTRGLELVVQATEQVRSRIFEVNRATDEQEKSTAYLLRNLSPLRDGMEMTLRATQEQVRSARVIADNIELANRKTVDISSAAQEQQAVNQQIMAATEDLLGMAAETSEQVQGNARILQALNDEIALLKGEMEQFRISG
ncbi:methyl-accepting chemotaxis protein [Desulfuromonas soudanensis]|nr:methyl-accepting chemotaxis protein [Desulfuromonas soudanensis]